MERPSHYAVYSHTGSFSRHEYSTKISQEIQEQINVKDGAGFVKKVNFFVHLKLLLLDVSGDIVKRNINL